jgi:hypothetical protein
MLRFIKVALLKSIMVKNEFFVGNGFPEIKSSEPFFLTCFYLKIYIN